MEQKNVKIFYKPVGSGELKELECVSESSGFEFDPLEEPVDVKHDQTPVTKGWSFSLDMVLDNKQYKGIRKLFYCRIPRKKKKRFKKGVARYHDCKIRDIKVSKYWGDIYDLTKDAIYGEYKPIIEADDYLSDNPKTYEEACEAAIKYCLEHLI